MKYYFKNVNLIDGTGEDLIRNTNLLVEDGVIKKIGSNINEEHDYELVDLSNKYLIPGIIDCHVHLFIDTTGKFTIQQIMENPVLATTVAMKNIDKLLKAGITYVRDAGAMHGYGIKLRNLIEREYISGPGIKCSGQFITMTGGHMHYMGREADGTDEVRKAAREAIKMGADFLKLVGSGGVSTEGSDVAAYQYNIDEINAAVVEAHKVNKKVAVHSHSAAGVRNAILAGADSIEHGTLMDENCVDMLVEHGTYLVPTLKASYTVIKASKKSGLAYSMNAKKIEALVNTQKNNFKKAYESGVKIAMGTDSGLTGNHFGDNAFELKLMTEYGMKELDAIVAATKTSAELLGINDKYGTLEEGKFADFIVLDKNPLEDIAEIQKLESVYKKGILVV